MYTYGSMAKQLSHYGPFVAEPNQCVIAVTPINKESSNRGEQAQQRVAECAVPSIDRRGNILLPSISIDRICHQLTTIDLYCVEHQSQTKTIKTDRSRHISSSPIQTADLFDTCRYLFNFLRRFTI